MFCVTALCCKILITVLVMFSLLKSDCFILTISLLVFIQFSQFVKEPYVTIITYKFVLADVGNQLKVGHNAMETDVTVYSGSVC